MLSMIINPYNNTLSRIIQSRSSVEVLVCTASLFPLIVATYMYMAISNSEDPTVPVYEIIQGNVHCANINKVKNGTESNLVIDENEHISSLATDNNRASAPQYRTAVDEATSEISASESFNLNNNLHYENILLGNQLQHLHDTDRDHPDCPQPASASSSISSYNDDFVYPNF